MSHFILNFCVYCDFESFACVLGFCCVPFKRGCEIKNEAKKNPKNNLKERVTITGSTVGSVEGKYRDFGKSTGEKNKGHNICCV